MSALAEGDRAQRCLTRGGFASAARALVATPAIVVIALLIGWFFLTRENMITFRAVLASVLPVLLCGGVIRAMTDGFAQLPNIPFVAVIFTIVAITVLSGAAFCWRITRRWHSPEPAP